MNDFEITAGGIRSYTDYGMLMLDGFSNTPPEPITHTVDIPGRPGGQLDLTEALTGDVCYGRRKVDLSLAMRCEQPDMPRVIREVCNAWNGRRLDFKLSWEQEYTYTGRFTVSAVENIGSSVLQFDVSIDADPFKVRDSNVYSLNCRGGVEHTFQCGRMSVHPTIECNSVTTVAFDGVETTLAAGTWRLNNVLFTSGANTIYINSDHIVECFWNDLASGGEHESTWDSLTQMRWDAVAALSHTTPTGITLNSWDDAAMHTWDELSAYEWRDIDNAQRSDDDESKVVDPTVCLTYDWKDL